MMEQEAIMMLICFVIFEGIGIFVLLAKYIYDCCEQLAKIDITFDMVKFLTVSYIDNHPEAEDSFNDAMGIKKNE